MGDARTPTATSEARRRNDVPAIACLAPANEASHIPSSVALLLWSGSKSPFEDRAIIAHVSEINGLGRKYGEIGPLKRNGYF